MKNYLHTSQGRDLLEKHNLKEEGFWKVEGEDPNCDWGGHHHNPFMGIYEGKLEDVIKTVIYLSSFWTWGNGGKITKIDILKPSPMTEGEAKRAKILAKLTKHEREFLGLK